MPEENKDQIDKPDEGGAEAASNLDKLLKSWDEGKAKETISGKPDEPVKTGDKEIISRLEKRVEQLETTQTDAEDEVDMSSFIKGVKGDLDADNPLVFGWIWDKVKEDKRISDIWLQRNEKKSEFQELVKSLAPQFKEYAKKNILAKDPVEDKDDDKDKDKGLTAAVISSRAAKSSTDYDSIDWSSLSPQEFEVKSAQVFRDAEKGKLK